ncbi:hypothetical protein ACT7DN_00190 [Bacillus paranthracis]
MEKDYHVIYSIDGILSFIQGEEEKWISMIYIEKLDEHINLVINKSGATEEEVVNQWLESIEETNEQIKKNVGGREKCMHQLVSY